MNPFTFHIGVDTHLPLSLLFIPYTGAMTKDARARQGHRLLLARLTPPIIMMKQGDAGSAADFLLEESIDGGTKM
jgi:hypothetical protein